MSRGLPFLSDRFTIRKAPAGRGFVPNTMPDPFLRAQDRLKPQQITEPP